METMYIRRAGTEQRVLLPDEIRDINNRRIGINPDSLAPRLLKQAVMNQITPASGAVSNVATSPIIGTVVKRIKLYNKLIANVI